jgi:arylsulfatase A-like enzyme
MPPNVLLVVLDAARRDALAPYSDAADTPTIASLAARGHVLARAYATSSWTLPSHTSLFTGLLPRSVGLGQPPDGTLASVRGMLERVSDRLLPVLMQRAGYATHGFSSNAWVSQHSGFDLGFDSFHYAPSGRTERVNALTGGGVRGTLTWALEGLRSSADDGAAELGTKLRASLEAHAPGRPGFWFVNLVECHSPYLPPRPWNDLGAWDRVQAALDSQRYFNFESICRHVAGVQEIPDESIERMRWLYGRSVSYMDHWLAGILDAFDRRGMLDETLVVVISDHGECFDENGLIAHGFGIDEALISVPVITCGPGAFACDEVFSLASLPGRILSACGVPEDRLPGAEVVPGVAVAQYDAMAPIDDPKIVAFARKFSIPHAGIARLCASYTAAVDGTRKLVVGDGDLERRYDLARDPSELSPLPVASRDSEAFVRLRRAIEGGAGAAPPAAGPTPAAPAASAEEVAELERQMKLLGYM